MSSDFSRRRNRSAAPKQRSSKRDVTGRIDVEQLERRQLMAADACVDADELLLDQYLLAQRDAGAEEAPAIAVDASADALRSSGLPSGVALASSRAVSDVPQMWLTAPAYGIRGENAVFTIALDKAPGSKPVSVWYTTVNGGAAAGTDFGTAGDRKAVVGAVVFSGTETTKEILVPILKDAPLRAPKPADFSVSLYAPSNAKIVNARATTSIASDRAGFQIDINFIGNVPPIVQGAAKTAVNKWQSVIIGDLPPVVVGGKFIDDFLMNVQMGLIGGMKSDGKDGVLANAWPMGPDGKKPAIRSASPTGNHTAYMGTTGIDPEDTDFAGLTQVLMHEMGHALGIGSFWKYQRFFPKDFPDLKLIEGADTDTPEYVGANAVAQYASYYQGTTVTGVPVQPYVLGHWDEDYLGTELMTPFAEDGPMPLSRVTLGALADLGYQVNYAKAEVWSPDGPLSATAGQGRTGNGTSGSVAAAGLLTNMGWGVVFTFRPTQSQETVRSVATPTSGADARTENAPVAATSTTVNDPTVTMPRRPVVRTSLAPAPKAPAAPAATVAAFRGYR